MEDGEEELSEQFVIHDSDFRDPEPGSILDELLKTTRTCTHTHTCNPPGPSAAHTHTCYHTHTQVIANEEEKGLNHKQQPLSKTRKPLGNREAVRKYREKKKAHTAYLEEEVKKLHLLNQQLVRKLQAQAVLEAEVLRLRTLLLDLRGKIEGDLRFFPLQKPCSVGLKEGDCGVRCETDIPCLHQNIGLPALAGIDRNEKIAGWEWSCGPPVMTCQSNLNGNMNGMLENNHRNLDHLMPSNINVVRGLVSSTSQAENQEKLLS